MCCSLLQLYVICPQTTNGNFILLKSTTSWLSLSLSFSRSEFARDLQKELLNVVVALRDWETLLADKWKLASLWGEKEMLFVASFIASTSSRLMSSVMFVIGDAWRHRDSREASVSVKTLEKLWLDTSKRTHLHGNLMKRGLARRLLFLEISFDSEEKEMDEWTSGHFLHHWALCHLPAVYFTKNLLLKPETLQSEFSCAFEFRRRGWLWWFSRNSFNF